MPRLHGVRRRRKLRASASGFSSAWSSSLQAWKGQCSGVELSADAGSPFDLTNTDAEEGCRGVDCCVMAPVPQVCERVCERECVHVCVWVGWGVEGGGVG